MSILAFREQLKKRGLGPGAQWLKADFHIHAPGSSDYEYKKPDAAEALGRTLAARQQKYGVRK